MQERSNKFKPVSKKQVPPPTSMNQETSFTQESKLSSNSQNKLFIRKPVPKRNGFISPNFTKNRVAQNEEVKSPTEQFKGNKFIQSDSRSDQDYWQGKDRAGFGAKLTLKKYITSQQVSKHELPRNGNNPSGASEAYYGNESHALTQIGEHYKVQAIESDNSEKDLYTKQNMKKYSKQNIVANGLSTKKVTRTEYFANPNTDEARSTTSRSLKEKQLNFNSLRHSVNNNIEAYVMSLQDNIRKLQKNNYTINKKCKWMHEEVEMHLQKEHLMTAEKKGLQLQLKAKDKQIGILGQEKSDLQKEIAELKIQIQKKQAPKSYKSFKDLQTISSLKQLCSKPQQTSFAKISKLEQNPQAYFGIIPSSIDKSKKKSFRTYPGVCSPRKSREQGSKCSSIAGNNQSFQDFGQSSVLYEKSHLKSQLTDSKYSVVSDDLKKQRDQLRATVESMTQEIKLLKDKHLEKINQNNQQFQQKLYEQQKNMKNLQKHYDALQNQKSILLIEIDKIQQNHQTEIQALILKIKDLENQISFQSRSPSPPSDLNLEEENPLKYFLENSQINKNYGQASQVQNLDHQNKSLRMYIQKIIEHYKYMKIENRMLLKVKEDKEKLEKEKKQIKEERDSFKKKLLDLLKNNKNLGKQPTKSCRRLMDFGSESSEEQDSAVFELSQSEIKLHDQNKFEKVQN